MVSSGRPQRLEKDQLSNLYEQISKPPSSFGYQSQRWTGKLLQQHIQRHQAVDLSLRQCQRLLKESAVQADSEEDASGHQE